MILTPKMTEKALRKSSEFLKTCSCCGHQKFGIFPSLYAFPALFAPKTGRVMVLINCYKCSNVLAFDAMEWKLIDDQGKEKLDD